MGAWGEELGADWTCGQAGRLGQSTRAKDREKGVGDKGRAEREVERRDREKESAGCQLGPFNLAHTWHSWRWRQVRRCLQDPKGSLAGLPVNEQCYSRLRKEEEVEDGFGVTVLCNTCLAFGG